MKYTSYIQKVVIVSLNFADKKVEVRAAMKVSPLLFNIKATRSKYNVHSSVILKVLKVNFTESTNITFTLYYLRTLNLLNIITSNKLETC